MQGLVKWFSARLGYGFLISPEVVDDAGQPQDIFAHYTKIQMEGFRKLEVGEEVAFDLVWSENNRPQAENITRVPNTTE